MPWSSSDYPPAFKNLPDSVRERAIRIAEAIRKTCVANGGDESQCAAKAIRIALSRVKERKMASKVLAEPTRLTRILENFNNKVRGVDIAIDVVHDPDRGAGAWIRSLEIAPSSSKPERQALWATVEWTEFGTDLIKDGQYRYISAEFGPHKDAESGKTFDDVLFAATLTNRPFVKGMAAVEPLEDGSLPQRIEILREGDYYHPQYGEVAIQADEGRFRRLYRALREFFDEESADPDLQENEPRLEEDKEIEANMEKALRGLLVARGVSLAEDADVMKALGDYLAQRDKALEDKDSEIAQLKEPNKELAESAAQTKTLSEANKKLTERVAELEQAGRDRERDVFLAEMVRKGKMRPADRERFEKLYKADATVTKDLLENGPQVVDLDEHGSGAGDETPTKSAMLIAEAKKLAEEKKMPLDKAVLEVLRDKPELGGDDE